VAGFQGADNPDMMKDEGSYAANWLAEYVLTGLLYVC
jgi:hypothetical protein